MTDCPQPNDTPDYERRFFTVLSESYDPDGDDFAHVHRDFFDAGEGLQAGVRSDGMPILLLPFTHAGLKMVLDAAKHWEEHNCPIAPELGLLLLQQAAQTLSSVLAEMPPELKDFRPFGH